MKSIIFSGAYIENYDYLSEINFDEYLIICADSGYKHAENLKIVPDVILGDNDSYLKKYPDNIKNLVFPQEKDFTDTHAAIDYAINNNAEEILIIGGLGGRIDHEFSHFCLMNYALDKGVKLKLINDTNEIWMENKPFKLKKSKRKYVSFFPYAGAVLNFSIKGLKYETTNMRLVPNRVQASSNEFCDSDTAIVTFDSGLVIVMLCDDRY